MAVADVAFRAIPKNSTCFIIWRIENLHLVPVPRDKYGSFFTGDSYVILSIAEFGDSGGVNMKVKEAKRSMDIHIHFWLGQTTSQDEAGVAAYKTVELDDYLGGLPVQHREVQGHESKRFLAYFKHGIRLLEGGVASGFHHVVDAFEPHMFIIKGKRRPIIRQLSSIAWELMNDGDVFVIDTKHVVIVWMGKFANNMEKIQGAKVALKLKSEHGPTSNTLTVEDGEENSLPITEKEYFNRFLPLANKKITPHTKIKPDEAVEKKQLHELKLYRCSDEGGTLKVTELKTRPLHQRDLLSQDSFIVDNGPNGIWVWVGKRASQKERTEAMRNAQGFIKKKGYPNHTQVTRVIDCGEPVEFKALFQGWKEVNQTSGLGKASTRGNIAKTIQTKFDAATLHDSAQRLAAHTQMIDDGSGEKSFIPKKVKTSFNFYLIRPTGNVDITFNKFNATDYRMKVWRVENFDIVPVDRKQYGRFYGGDCYVIKYTYHTGTREATIIYYWLGKRATNDEKGVAALKTIEMDNEMGGTAVQVRVMQGKEPPSFLTVFGGRLIIFEGGKASGFRNLNEKDESVQESYMLQVHGSSAMNTRAVQVEMRAASLNSNDVFVVFRGSQVFIWAGLGSTGDEREMAKLVAADAPREAAMVYEGQEKDDFWDAIGGKENYSNNKRLHESNNVNIARIFHCSNASGVFKVEEIFDFDQSDLIEEDVMILDAWDAVFVWIGRLSNAEERQKAEKTAEEYLRTDPSGRDLNTPIYRIKQGFEPPNFTGFFGIWDRSVWNNKKTYDQMRQELREDNPGITHINVTMDFSFIPDVPKFPLEVLAEKDPEKLPPGVDPTRKEIYLEEEDFEEIFGMKLLEFEGLPQWKKIAMKRKVSLF
uniref:HP domain-containing protein n=1 Tax=Strigamia maritima TaxID=126957 RepID=T1IV90_STRMM